MDNTRAKSEVHSRGLGRRRRRQRLIMLGLGACVLVFALSLIRYAARDAFAYFYTPEDFLEAVGEGRVRLETPARLGGLVERGSVVRADVKSTRFRVTDGVAEVTVICSTACTLDLPDLFREGQGVVIDGHLAPDTGKGTAFLATRILAKHDERYMPRSVADELKDKGYWQGPVLPTDGVPK